LQSGGARGAPPLSSRAQAGASRSRLRAARVRRVPARPEFVPRRSRRAGRRRNRARPNGGFLDLLLERGASTPTSLADGLPITRQAIGKHLAVLERAGLIDGKRSGREMHYRVNIDRLDDATRSLGELASA